MFRGLLELQQGDDVPAADAAVECRDRVREVVPVPVTPGGSAFLITLMVFPVAESTTTTSALSVPLPSSTEVFSPAATVPPPSVRVRVRSARAVTVHEPGRPSRDSRHYQRSWFLGWNHPRNQGDRLPALSEVQLLTTYRPKSHPAVVVIER